MAVAISSRNVGLLATSGLADTSTPSVNRPRITTCSTLSSSTWCLDSTPNRVDVTPGWSTPVTVISTDTLAVLTRGGRPSEPGAGAHRADPPGWSHLEELVAGVTPDVCLGAQPLHHVRVVQLERRSLGADPGQLGEVVPGRRAAGRPLQRVAVPPRVVDGHHLAVAPALEDVPDEDDHRRAEDERPDGGDDVQGLEAVGGQVVGVAPRHAHVAQPVLHQKRGVKPDEGQPEVQLAQPLVQQPPGHFREPEVDAGEG